MAGAAVGRWILQRRARVELPRHEEETVRVSWKHTVDGGWLCRVQRGATVPEGLRERKRRQTHERLETAAVTTAVAEGVGAVTVDRVCEAAMVSRSTFFNYFASLDQAIFGAPLTFDSAGAARILRAHPNDLVLAAIRILDESATGPAPAALRPYRLTLLIRESGASRPVSPTHAESRDRLIRILSGWLESHPDRARLPEVPPGHEAELTVALALAVAAEVLPGAGRTDIDLAAYATVRARLAAIITEPGAGSARSGPGPA